MAKRNLKFDAGELRGKCSFYEFTTIPDGYGGTRQEWVLRLETRCKRNIKNKTSQSQLQAGSFDFYQVYEFIIRDRVGFSVEKDMIVYSDGVLHVIKGVVPMENNPNYVMVICSTINDSEHALWGVINAMPITEDKPNIIIV